MDYPHIAFVNDVSKDTMSLLSYLSNSEEPIEESLLLKIRSILDVKSYFSGEIAPELIELRFRILYRRYCNIVQRLIDEYSQYDIVERRERIDYFLFHNTLKELKFLGSGAFYDMKFKPSTATLYKGHVEESNWTNEIRRKHGDTKNAEAVQFIFKTCREHINIGGDVILKSYSKCFILDLFKYIALHEEDGSFIARVIVKKEAPLNYIYANGQAYSLQQYIESNIPLKDTQFIIDFSEPRDFKRENFNLWYEDFVGEDFKDTSNSTHDETDFMALFLKQLMKKSKPVSVSRMVSPVADREVIMSCDLWELIDYQPSRLNDDVLFHFSFSETALYELIFTYFKVFFEQADISYLFPTFKENVFKSIEQLIKTVEETDSKNDSAIKENIKNITAKLHIVKSLLIKPENSIKIQQLLALVDWTYELEFWKIDNMSTFELKKIYNKKNENILINIFKYYCVDIARRIYFENQK